jgi:hypothetical protein
MATNLNIEVNKTGLLYVADCMNLPGTPPIGRGKSRQEAIGSLLYALSKEQEWRKYLGFSIVIKDNNEQGSISLRKVPENS